MKKLGLRQILTTLTLVAILVAAPIAQSQPQNVGNLLLDDYPVSYTVDDSDTLWNIASQFLQDPERWPDLWQPDEFLDNADLIYPGDVLRIGFVGGSPRILVQRGGRDVTRLAPMMREELLSSAIPAIPSGAIEKNFTRSRIVDRELFEAAPYIISNLGDGLTIGTGDEVYARGNWPNGTSTFEVYREGRTYMDDSGEQALGLEIDYMGFASISKFESTDIRRMVINNSSKEMKVGDRLLIREESSINTTIYPTEPVADLQGQIIALMSEDSMASQLDTVVVNLGLRDELVIGDILSIQKAGRSTIDEVERDRMTLGERFRNAFTRDRNLVQLPGAEIGTLLIYKIFDQLSYALILSSTEPVELYNTVVSP